MIAFKLVARKKPGDATSNPKLYAIANSSQVIRLEDLAVAIAERCTVTDVDIIAVLTGFMNEVPKQLALGNIVQLGDFGSFRNVIHSEGVDNPEDFNKSKIKRVKTHFRPGSGFLKRLQNLRFEKIAG
jgi:predicted histone-like DNA-binding protein